MLEFSQYPYWGGDIQNLLDDSMRRHILTGKEHTEPQQPSTFQAILGIPPLYLQLQWEARVTAIRRLNIPLPDTLTAIIPGEVENGETGWAAHPAECPTREQISLVDGGGITLDTSIYTDGSKTEIWCRGSILRLVRAKYSLQMVGKTARLQYTFPGGTFGIETRNRPCN
ncbi:hypothetical protein AVEN_52292-1 [Araneus ventricosus]|uniref:Uncharacterized protein n=1 Tax=Araneus ventricosus TaxID=182803 RepID=A0A4Y2IMS5_ARAVE|nr:hypothetical protein AVEN_240473-1 [Araneus ventricosus]GBM79171.1 hypothetical protein AVEN_52292-1 [Araneus ventricosus]